MAIGNSKALVVATLAITTKTGGAINSLIKTSLKVKHMVNSKVKNANVVK